MASANLIPERAYQKYAWLILFIVGILVTLGGFYELFSGIDPNDFQTSTGVDWNQFLTSQPEVAAYLSRGLRLAGIGYLCFALFAAILAIKGFRKGERWAWYLMWIFPLGLGLTSALFFIYESGLGIFYGIAALICLLGVLLPFRKFFPKT